MLKILVKKQLAEVFSRTLNRRRKTGKDGKARSSKGMLVVLIILTAYMAAMFTGMALILSEPLFAVGMGFVYYLLMTSASILFGTLGSVFSTFYTLYLAKDNDLLLSMPIPVRDVIASRLLSVYVIGLFYTSLIMLPTVVVGLIRGGVTVSTLLCGLILALLASLVVLGLSCLLGWVVARLSLRLKNKSWITVLLSLGFLALYYAVYFRIMNRIQDLMQNVILFGQRVKDSAYVLYRFGRIGEGDWPAALLWTLAILAVLVLIWFVMKRSFLATATASAAAGKKTAGREKAIRQGSVSAALLRREWLRFTSSANYMLNCGLGIVMLMGLGVYLAIQGKTLLQYIVFLPRGLEGSLPVLLTAACCLLAGMIDISTPSVSLEGKTIWQIQSLPVTAWQVLRAKLELHLGLSAVPLLFCAVVLMILAPATLAQKLLMLAVTMLAGVFNAALGLFLGLKMPNLDWTNEVVPIKQSVAVFISMFAGMCLGIAIGGLYLLFGYRIGPTGWLGVTALLLLAADAALFLWLRGPGVRRFEEL